MRKDEGTEGIPHNAEIPPQSPRHLTMACSLWNSTERYTGLNIRAILIPQGTCLLLLRVWLTEALLITLVDIE